MDILKEEFNHKTEMDTNSTALVSEVSLQGLCSSQIKETHDQMKIK